MRWCAGRGERHLRRCSAMAAVVEMVTATLPKLERLGYTVEDGEANTAELQTSCPTRFCGGARARRRRSRSGNGGAAACLAQHAVEAKKCELERVSASGRRAGCSRRG